MKIGDKLPTLSGATVVLNNQENLIVEKKLNLVLFWSISCQICKRIIHNVQQFSESNENVNLIFVHMPRSEKELSVDLVKECMEVHHILQPTLIDNQHNIADLFQNRYVPSLFLFDRQNQLLYKKSGEIDITELESHVKNISEWYLELVIILVYYVW